MMTGLAGLAACAASIVLMPGSAAAQATRDSATVIVLVTHDSVPIAGATVSASGASSRTAAAGAATLRLLPGRHLIVVTRIGYLPDTLEATAQSGAPVTVTADLTPIDMAEIVIVASTRTDRRIDDDPVRVEVLEREEIEEKILMTPGDISMLLNETSGLRVQTTSPSLGGASVRIQGLAGRHSQLLADGLPLYGGQAGGLGLLQIAPVDLGRVEVIKGAASALYGSSALGGVINLISRRPSDATEREILLNQTSRGGTDAVLWLSGPLSASWGATLIAGAHRQSQRDLDADGWTDLAGYERANVRPRAFWSNGLGSSLFATAGITTETREGGTMPDRTAPDGAPFPETLETQRADAGLVGRFLFSTWNVSTRASLMHQRHEHGFGSAEESDRHTTAFAEAAVALQRGLGTWLIGVAMQRDAYRSTTLPEFDYTHDVASAFAQATFDPSPRVALTVNARVDGHSEYGTAASPRLSALVRLPREWHMRASIGGGTFAPTPFTDETEVVGLGALEPLGRLDLERATTGSLDVGGPLGPFEVNGTLFASRVAGAIQVIASESGAMLALTNAPEPTRTHGAEAFARWSAEPWTVTASHTYVVATEHDPESASRRDVPLTPRHASGIVAMWELEERARVGAEFYYTGEQALDDNPYREHSRAYVIVGLLAEYRLGRARLFVNGENLSNARQTRYDRLVRPSQGVGGRWTTDAWTELSGRTVNGGVRFAF
jgi:iron complex outermembrane receptor protein